MKRSVAFVWVLFYAFHLFGQAAEQQDNVWTLKECIDYALANNLDVQRSAANLESSEINYDLARAAVLPTVNASVGNGYNWGRSINPVTNTFTTQQIRSLSPNVNSSVTLFNGFRILNTIKQNAREYEASGFDLEKARNDVALNVINLYINVIFNKELFENAQLQLASSKQQLERTRKQVEAGALPLSEALNLDAQVATNEVNVVTNENSLNLSILQLKQALLLPASVAFEVEAPQVSVEELVLDQSSQEIYEVARQTLPEMKSAQLRLSSSAYAIKAARGGLFPRLSLSGSISSNYSSANDRAFFIPDPNGGGSLVPTTQVIGYTNSGGSDVPVYAYDFQPEGYLTDGYGYSDQLQDNLFKSVSISLSIPLLNGFQQRGSVRRARVSQQLSEITLKQTQLTLRQNVETAYNDAYAASKSYNSSLRQVEAREEAFRMTKQRFEIGAANFVEYQVAENELFRAKSDLARAKYNYIFRKKLLDFYSGKPLGF